MGTRSYDPLGVPSDLVPESRDLRTHRHRGLMVFTGNAISAWYVLWLHQNPTVSWADPFYLTDSLLTLFALRTLWSGFFAARDASAKQEEKNKTGHGFGSLNVN